MKLTKSPKLSILLCALLSIITTANTFASDDICNNDNVPDDVKAASGCSGYDVPELPNVVIGILNAIIGIAGIIAVVFIVIGGVNYMTSSGDAAKVKKAKDTILYACIGLIVCALAFAIVNWVIKAVS